MGHKVNPVGIRLNITRTSTAKWCARPREYADFLIADLKARAFIAEHLSQAGVASVQIERAAKAAKITIFVARPGVVIGKKGGYIERIRAQLAALISVPVNLSVVEVKRPELEAKLVAENIAQQLERRVLFRRAMKRAQQTAMRFGAKGVKIEVSGRLGGVEIARRERSSEGSIPLHTFRADIDYALAEAQTTYGKIGVKVWINKGEIFDRVQAVSAENTESKARYFYEKEQKQFRGKRPSGSQAAGSSKKVVAEQAS